MKNAKKTILTTVSAFVVGMLLSINSSHALLGITPPTPIDPTIDGLTDPMVVLDNIAKGLNKAQSFYNEAALKANSLVNSVKNGSFKQSILKYAGIDDVFAVGKGGEVMSTPGSREVVESCNMVDVYDQNSVKDGVEQLFLAFPSDDTAIKTRYRSYGSKFYQDTLVEVYVTSRKLEDKLEEMRKLVAELPNNLREGADGAKEGDNKVAVLENNKIAYETMDKVLQLLEEAVALKAQYEAAKHIKSSAQPAEFVPQKTSHLSSEVLNFAQAEEAKAEASGPEGYIYKATSTGFELAPPSGNESPLQSSTENLEELAKLDSIYEDAKVALDAHNLINTMPTYKKIFDEYARQKRLHEKTIEDLKISDQCVIQYLGRYYENPQTVWTGRNIGDLVNAYELREGLSGWAISAFEVAKANSITPVDVDSFETTDITDRVDLKNADKVGSIEDSVGIDESNVNSIAPIKNAEDVEQNNRETKMLSWNVGAAAAKILVADQYSEEPKWGAAKKKFAIWTDQKNFYDQYIEGKYDNIKEYIKPIDTRKTVLNIISLLNAKETAAAVASKSAPDDKKIEMIKGKERQEEIQKISRMFSGNIEGLLGKTPDNSIITKANSDRTTAYNNAVNQWKQFRVNYRLKNPSIDLTSVIADYPIAKNMGSFFSKRIEQKITDSEQNPDPLSPQQLAELRANDERLIATRFNADYARFQAIYAYELERVNKNFDDKLIYDADKSPLKEYDNVIGVRSEHLSEAALKIATDGDSAISSLVAARINDYNAIKADRISKEAGLKKVRQRASDQLDIATINLGFYNDKIDELQQKIKDAETEASNMEMQVKISKEYFKGEKDTETYTAKEKIDYEETVTLPTETESTINYTTETVEKEIDPFYVDPTFQNVTTTTTTIKEETITPDGKISVKEIKSEKEVEAPNVGSGTIRLFRKKPNTLKPEAGLKSFVMSFAQASEEAKEHEGEAIVRTIKEVVEEVQTIETVATESQTVEVDEQVADVSTTITTPTETREYTDVKEEAVIRKIEGEKAQVVDAKLKAEASKSAALVAGQNINGVRVLAKAEQKNIDALQKIIIDVDNQLKNIEATYVEKLAQSDRSYDAKIIEATNKVYADYVKAQSELPSVLSVYASIRNTNSVGGLLGASLFPQVDILINKAQKLVDDSKEYAQVLVEKAKQDIYSLGDSLYLPESNALVVQRHNELMDELKVLNTQKLISNSTAISAVSSQAEIVNMLSTIYQSALVLTACKEDACKQSDIDYFIAVIAKPRDMKAPFAPPTMYLPPLREVFYFDGIAYVNVKKSGSKTTKENFLSFGGEIPAVWKVILKDNAFVERSVDLKQLLNQGGEALSFMNGGVFPCNSGDYTISVDTSRDTYAVNRKIEGDYPKCYTIEFAGKAGIYYNIRDIESGVTGAVVNTDFVNLLEMLGIKIKHKVPRPRPTVAANTSELGIFLKVDNEGFIRFSDTAYKVFSRIEVVAAEASKSDSKYKPDLRDGIFRRALFDKNQIGDFLTFVEREQSQKQNVDSMAAKVIELKETMFEQLKKLGFEPKEDLDLANANDYALVVNKLKSIKNEKATKASSEMNKVAINGQEVIKERLSKLKRIFGALQKDKEAYIAMSEITSYGSDLDEALKSEEVNRKAVDTYAKKADEEFEKQLKNAPRPFCAIY